MTRFRYLADVVTLALDDAKCTGCGMCVSVCPHAVFDIDDHKASIVDRDACMECGACQRNCPSGAVTVRSGVGCATALIMQALGSNRAECCCAQEGACSG